MFNDGVIRIYYVFAATDNQHLANIAFGKVLKSIRSRKIAQEPANRICEMHLQMFQSSISFIKQEERKKKTDSPVFGDCQMICK